MIVLAGQSNLINLAAYFIGAATVGKGGSAITEWLPGEELFEALKVFVPKAEVLFFWQGEAEAIAGDDSLQYWRRRGHRLFTELRQSRPALPILIGQCPNLERVGHANLASLRRQQEHLTAETPNATLLAADDLPMADHHHVAPEGLLTMAQRVAFQLNTLAKGTAIVEEVEV